VVTYFHLYGLLEDKKKVNGYKLRQNLVTTLVSALLISVGMFTNGKNIITNY
jgi:hypothetical protein